jgi:hypothetical protein
LSVFCLLYCLSFVYCIVCLLSIVLSVFCLLYCLSFVYCIVCLLSIVLSVLCLLYCRSFVIVLSVFRIMTTDYPFGLFNLFLNAFYFSEIMWANLLIWWIYFLLWLVNCDVIYHVYGCFLINNQCYTWNTIVCFNLCRNIF